MKQSEEMKRFNEEFKKSPAYAEMMENSWIEKDVNGFDVRCFPEDFETNYEEYKKQKKHNKFSDEEIEGMIASVDND